jgi:hypothetical protein
VHLIVSKKIIYSTPASTIDMCNCLPAVMLCRLCGMLQLLCQQISMCWHQQTLPLTAALTSGCRRCLPPRQHPTLVTAAAAAAAPLPWQEHKINLCNGRLF